MKPTLRVILIEDSPDDSLLIVRELEHAGYAVQAQRVETAEELRDALAQGTWDLVLADYSLPHFSATEGLAMLWQTGLDVPFIIVSGSIGEETAVQLMRDGAADYVMKDHLSRLAPALQRELYDAGERKAKRDVEHALADSEKRYRVLVESQVDLIVKTDPEGRILYANPSYCALFGRKLEKLTNSLYQPLVDPDDLPSVERAVADLFHPPHACRYEERAMTVDGWRWIEWTAQAELDSHGTVVALFGSGRDVTERKQMEDKLRLALLPWTQFLEACPDAMWIKDASGRYMAANQMHSQVAPSVYGDVVGKTDAECYPLEQAATYVADDRVSIEKGASDRELAIAGVDGKLHTFQIKNVVLRAPDGSVAGTLGISRDITVLKHAERALQESESKYHAVIDQSLDGFVISDEHGDIDIWNQSMTTITGIQQRDAVGRPLWEIQSQLAPDGQRTPELLQQLQTGMKSIMESGRPWPGESRNQAVVCADGTRKVLQDTSFLVGTPSGVRFGVIIRDITEREEAQKQRETLQAQLHQAQKLEAIGELAGGVAHDFNNLLTGIMGNVSIMRGDLPSSDPLLSNLDAIEDAAHQAADLARGLLTFGRKAMVRVAPLDMTQAVETALGILKQSLPATITIVRDIEAPSWNVMADLSQTTQVIMNLAVNARDAMEGAGTLTICLRNELVGEDYVRTHAVARTGEFVHLSVSDTGPGIPEEVRAHLFEPFFTTKAEGHGTGLGLSIVYGAVKQTNGWVTAESPEGGGAVFDVFLPRCLEQPAAPAGPASSAAGSVGGTVLIVEDEEVVLTITAAILKRTGYTPLTAKNGALALRVLEENLGSIDLILLDMTMPGMTTQEIVPAFRALSPTVPIVLTSGFGENSLIQHMLEDGAAQAFLGKPYATQELLDAVSGSMKRL